jgi:hypothetical protein
MITVLSSRDKKVAAKGSLPALTVNMWLEAIKDVSNEDPVPEGFITLEQVKEIMGLRRSSALLHLDRLERAGRLEKRKIRRRFANGKIRWSAVYKILPK